MKQKRRSKVKTKEHTVVSPPPSYSKTVGSFGTHPNTFEGERKKTKESGAKKINTGEKQEKKKL